MSIPEVDTRPAQWLVGLASTIIRVELPPRYPIVQIKRWKERCVCVNVYIYDEQLPFSGNSFLSKEHSVIKYMHWSILFKKVFATWNVPSEDTHIWIFIFLFFHSSVDYDFRTRVTGKLNPTKQRTKKKNPTPSGMLTVEED